MDWGRVIWTRLGQLCMNWSWGVWTREGLYGLGLGYMNKAGAALYGSEPGCIDQGLGIWTRMGQLCMDWGWGNPI